MQSKTFSVNGGARNATVTVRTKTGRAYIIQRMAEHILGVNDDGLSDNERLCRAQFANAYAQSEVEGDLGFSWPSSAANPEAMLQACDAWLSLPSEAIELWQMSIIEVDMPLNDPDLLPPELVEKKG